MSTADRRQPRRAPPSTLALARRASLAFALATGLAACGASESGQESAAEANHTPEPGGPAVVARGDGAAAGGPSAPGTTGLPAQAKPPAVDPEALAVTVNGAPITEGQIQSEIAQQIMMQTGGMALPPDQLAAFAPQMRPQVLNGMIDNALLDTAVTKEGVVIEEAAMLAELERQLEGFLLSNNITREMLAERMVSQGTTLEAMMAEQVKDPQAARMMQHAELLRRLKPEQVAVSDEEVASAYAEQLEQAFTRAEQVRASHILIGAEGGLTEEQKPEAKAKAEEVLQLARTADVAFADLAKEHSTGPSGPNGGDLGFFPRHGAMLEPFAAAAFELQPGEISDIVETQYGYHIIQVTDRNPAEVLTLEQVGPSLRASLEMQKIIEQRNLLLTELRTGAEIVYPEGHAGGAAQGGEPGHDEHDGHDH